MRVLLLCHKAFVPKRLNLNIEKTDNAFYRTELYVYRALKRLGHQIAIVGIDKSFEPLKTIIKTYKPHIVFNLVEEFDDQGLLEPLVVSYLENSKVPYTGCSEFGLIAAKNKIAAKAILKDAGLQVPEDRKFPQIIKFIDEESSRGISEKSVVKNKSEKLEQIKKMRTLGDGGRCYSEEFIDGREMHVGVLVSGGKFIAGDVWETTFGLKQGHKIISEKVKWNFAYREKCNIALVPAINLSNVLKNKVRNAAVRGVEALGIDGYARVDIRLTKEQDVYIIEVNPNPDLAYGDEFVVGFSQQGMAYDALIHHVLNQGLTRSKTNAKKSRSFSTSNI